MSAVAAASDPFGGEWAAAPTDWLAPLVPPTGDAEWTAMPLITDLFPWQQPGCKFGRTWPVAPTAEALERRWRKLASARRDEKPSLFFTATSGRNTDTQVDGYIRLADVAGTAQAEPRVRYSYRSFDRQWALDDPRLAKTDSPSLWQTQSSGQVFLASRLTGQMSSGPCLTASAYVPDLHVFRGSDGGKDIIPLWRDAAATEPNLTADLAETLGRALGVAPPSVEDVAAYAYSLLSATAYQTRFAEALRTPGLRVPLTADADLWREAVAAGHRRLWLHTYAERFRDADAGRGAHVPLVAGVEWETAVTRLPRDGDDIAYDAEAAVLTVADGTLTGVRADVWAYEVSGMPVVRKWLGYRTAKGAGRAASSKNALDRIRPDAWPDAWNDELQDLVRVLTLTLDAEAELADLLARVCDGPLIEADRLPRPSRESRQPPATLPRRSQAAALAEPAEAAAR